MITNASELEFTSDDNANWAAFLRTQTGQRLLPKLVESAPRLLIGGGTNEILIASGMLLGFQQAVQALFDLQSISQSPQRGAEAYPDLEDNSQWPEPTKH